MISLIKYILIIFLYLFFNTTTFAGTKYGKGDLELSDFVVEAFIKYIKGKSIKSPYMFAVSHDGLNYQYYYCPSGPGNCSGGDENILAECSRYANGVDCSLFARTRTIKWNNGINPGKGKKSKIKSKWSDQEIKDKLKELGFIGSQAKNNKNLSDDIVKDLEALTDLYEGGAISKEEFEKAKKKILN